jgi:hypothetical protein
MSATTPSPDAPARRREDVYSTIVGSVLVLLVAAALAAGIPRLDGALSRPQDVRAGSVVDVDRGVSFTAEEGWHLEKSATGAIPVTVLNRDADRFTVSVLSFEEGEDRGWFDENAGEGGGRISYADRVPFQTDSGLSGETYYYHGQDLAGQAWVIGAEDQGVAIRAVLQSTPPDFDAVFPAAEVMAKSITGSADGS